MASERYTRDLGLADLERRAFDIARPSPQRVPFIFAFPHSGRVYPDGFVASSRLGATALRRSEDAYVDELFSSATWLGAPVISARFPRAFLDVNRAPSELDPAMFDGQLQVPFDTASARVNAGLGVIPRIVRDGAEIYRGKLPAREAGERISKFYKPYHAALNALIEDTRREFRIAIIVDCHSMPSAAAVPDIVLGDRYGMSAAHALMRGAERAFEQSAFTVARNAPYAGGYTTHLYGRPALGVHALQIEINRALYLDEERIERAPSFASVQARIADALDALTMVEPGLVRGPSRQMPWAAE
jgi:N-formylglutamate deformylase